MWVAGIAMAWSKGWSWTKGYWAETENPDGSKDRIYVHSGLFYFNPNCMGLFYCYMGFRPTPVWSAGYGNEGWFFPIARWLKKIGWGNFGIALRRTELR